MAKALPTGMRKKGRKFYGRYKRREKCFGDHRITAQKLFSAWKHGLDMGEFGLGYHAKQNTDLEDILEDYLHERDGQVTEKYLDGMERHISEMLDRLKIQRVSDLTVQKVERVRKVLIRKGNSNRTINMKVEALGTMLRWAGCGARTRPASRTQTAWN